MTTFTNTSLHVEAIGTDGAIWHRGLTSGTQFNAWESFGGNCRYYPEAVTLGASTLHCFVIEGRIDLFGIGLDASLQHQCYSGGKWSSGGWESLQGGILGKPKAVSVRPGRLDVFVTGMDSAIWHKAWNGSSWLDWHSLGEAHQYNPEAVVWCRHRIDLFSVSTDTNLLHLVGDVSKSDIGTWGSTWEKLGGSSTSTPKACVRSGKLLDVFFRGADSSLMHKAWDGAGWKPTATTNETLQGSIITKPC